VGTERRLWRRRRCGRRLARTWFPPGGRSTHSESGVGRRWRASRLGGGDRCWSDYCPRTEFCPTGSAVVQRLNRGYLMIDRFESRTRPAGDRVGPTNSGFRHLCPLRAFSCDKGSCAFSVGRILHDYRFDVWMSTYSATGEVENGFVWVQVKGTDVLKRVRTGS
jgi:hypothetical protein